MLLQAKVVFVPAHQERDADLNEYGKLSVKVMGAFGEAAIEAGAPDHNALDPVESATDAITNILHWLSQQGHAEDISRVLNSADGHFTAETGE